jgi:hypothetical protein
MTQNRGSSIQYSYSIFETNRYLDLRAWYSQRNLLVMGACMCIIERATVNNDGSRSQSTPFCFGNWVAPEVSSKWCQAFTQGSRGSLTPSISPCWSAIPASSSALFYTLIKAPHRPLHTTHNIELPSVNSLSLLANCFVRDRVVKRCHPWHIQHMTHGPWIYWSRDWGEEGSKAWVRAIMETTSANKT